MSTAHASNMSKKINSTNASITTNSTTSDGSNTKIFMIILRV